MTNQLMNLRESLENRRGDGELFDGKVIFCDFYTLGFVPVLFQGKNNPHFRSPNRNLIESKFAP